MVGHLLASVVAVIVVASPAAPPAQIAVVTLQQSYASLEDVRVQITNRSLSPVYLRSAYAVPLLQRWNEALGIWESSPGPVMCGTDPRSRQPLAIAAGASLTINADWQRSVVTRDGQKLFATGLHSTMPLPGKYRVVVPYALVPWLFGSQPAKTYEAVSNVFFLSA